jgi:hypothetical protein
MAIRNFSFIKETMPNSVGRAMAQAVSRRPPTAEARFRSRVSPCGICGGQSGIGTGFSASTSVFPCQFHSTGAPLLGQGQKIIIIIVIFITGLHKKPRGCGASVASAAGPFTTKKKNSVGEVMTTISGVLLETSSRISYQMEEQCLRRPVVSLFPILSSSERGVLEFILRASVITGNQPNH